MTVEKEEKGQSPEKSIRNTWEAKSSLIKKGQVVQLTRKLSREFDIAKEVYAYLKEEDDLEADTNPWPGNHAFLNDFRNQMTHRVSPNVSSISSLGGNLRPPTLYVLHRAIEDYYKVSSFLCRLINQFLDERKDWLPIGMEINKQ